MNDQEIPGRPLSAKEIMRVVRHQRAKAEAPGRDARTSLAHAEPLPHWRSVIEPLAVKQEYVLGDFLALSDLDFVDTAFRALLKRMPEVTQPGVDVEVVPEAEPARARSA